MGISLPRSVFPRLTALALVGGGAHAVDEWVDIESLPQRAALIAGLIEKV